MLSDLSVFFRSLTGIIEGFSERTRGVAELLRSPETAFLIVTSPEQEPAREALFLADRLASANMPGPGLIVNRVHRQGLNGRSVEEVEALLKSELEDGLAARVAHNLADFDVLARRDQATIADLSERLGGTRATLVEHLDEEVQDLVGLTRIAEQLLG